MLGALVAGVIAPVLSHSPVALAMGQLSFTLIAISLWLGGRRYRRLLDMRKEPNAWETVE
jgi:DHA1 family bicyclomycin/chloramphenicol resistance-like MFS transporter